MPSNYKKLVRARMEKTGESWSTAARHVRAQAPTTTPTAGGAIEVLVFDPSGRQFLELVWFVPPGLRNGPSDPTEGLIMSSPRLRNGGRYLLVEPTGLVRHVLAERGAGGGAYMTVFTEPDTFAAVQMAYASADLDANGMPSTFARYKVVPDRSPPPGRYRMGILPVTDAATVKGLHTFGLLVWRELFAMLDTAHPGLARHVALDGAQDDAFDIEEHAAANSAVREAASVRGEVQGRVLKTDPVGTKAPRPTTQADLDDLGAADRISQEVHRAQMGALRQNPPPPGGADHAFEVVVRSGSGTVTVLRGATLATAHAQARMEARKRRGNVYIRNAITGVTQPIGPG